ncbi:MULTISPECIES: Rieske 2Fe-2S domain-containing protein [Nostocales]|uniref:Rieske 2Fe-2S domain-containing protein n=1 Tax=Nostocales TaxID=1161 RepID=UPI001F45075B|nr:MULTISPECIES: Rieske 2Fe-2S domain-containing protein [Nostocales]
MTNADLILINDWYVVAKIEDCKPGSITTASLLGVKLVLWRSHEQNSPIQVWQDHCPHRGVALSMGEIANNTLVCAYHGWRYNQAGKCVQIPAHPDMIPPASAIAKTYHCQERYGLVWVCLGSPVNDIPSFPEWDVQEGQHQLGLRLVPFLRVLRHSFSGCFHIKLREFI